MHITGVFKFIIPLLLIITTICFAQTDEIVAEGTGLGANRQEALINARRDAIEKGIGLILLSRTEIENFMLKKDQIITKTMGSVKNYEILSEGPTPDNLFQIKIKAVLSQANIREDLAAFHILIESMNKPRVMVIITENNVGNEEPTNQSAETAVIRFLRAPYQFEVIDPQVTASIRASRQKMAAIKDDPAAAAAIGSQFGAEVIIAGSAVSREARGLSTNLGGMISVQADVNLKAINCATAAIIGASSGHGAKAHISPNTAGNNAIALAAEKAMKDLLNSVIDEWQQQLNNGIPISISVNNVTAFRQKTAIVQTLSCISDVAVVHERGWDADSKTLRLDIQYKGDVNGFCTRIDGFKLKAGGGSLSVTGTSGTAVTLTAEAM